MNIQYLLDKILDADLSRSVKEDIVRHWMLPPKDQVSAPIQKVKESDVKLGVIRRPSKEQLDLRKNPKKKEEQEAMEETFKEVLDEEDKKR